MSEDVFRFAPHDEGAPEAKDQDRINVLAVCIAHQQHAGFKNYLDVRELHCATCKASGFNTGWGYWQFACGLTILSDGEGDNPCAAQVEPAA